MTVKVICSLTLLFFAFRTEVFPKEWNGITPCISSRSDAERLLGKNTIRSVGPYGNYLYKDSRVYIYYFSEDNVPNNDLVAVIEVYPKKSIRLAKFVQTIPEFTSKFRKSEMDPKITHIRYLAHYFNASEGFEIEVQKDEDDREIIHRFAYYGANADCSKREEGSGDSW